MDRPVIGGEFAPLHPGSDQSAGPEPPSLEPAVERGVVVEILGAQGQVRSRARLTTLPAVIGRGYDADLLIDDPHVCARHAELRREDDGTLVLIDLESVNGSGRARGERLQRIPLASGDRARLGPVEIRVLEATHAVAAALPMSERRGLTTGLLRPARAIAVCAGALLAFSLLNYQSSAAADAVVPAMQEGVYMLAGVALWACAWALATRLVSRNFRFLPHWAWSLGVLLVVLLLTVVGEWIDFVGPSVEAGSWLIGLGGLALIPILIAGHLEIASSMTSRKRWRAALSAAGIVVALTAIASLGEDGMSDTWSLEFSGTLKPLPDRLVPAMSLEGFMQATESLRADVDAMAEEDLPDDVTRADSAEAMARDSLPERDPSSAAQ